MNSNQLHRLGDLQLRILKILWGRPESSVAEVHAALAPDSLAYTTIAVAQDPPEDGNQFLVATLLITNKAPSESFLRYDGIVPLLTDADGAQFKYEDMVLGASNQPVAQNMAAGQSLRVRIFFTVPTTAKPNSLAISQDDSRAYQYQLTQP